MNRKFIVVMMCIVAVMILIALPCIGQAAMVATDRSGYGLGETVIVVGMGWQPNEFVSLVLYYDTDYPGTPHYTLTQAQADADGNFINMEYVIQAGDEDKTFILEATGTSSGSAQTTFYDVANLRTFEDASRNVQRDAFAWGATVYARAGGLGTTKCAEVRWIDPGGTTVETHDLTTLTNDRPDSFVIPASGPSGVWKAELYLPTGLNTACPGIRRDTSYFDVAQIVVIGADDSYIVSHLPDLNTNSTIVVKNFLDVNGEADDTEKTFLRFQIPYLPGDVVSAKVRMRLLVPPGLSNSQTYNINRITSLWDVDKITWNNQPDVAGAPTDSQPTPTGLSAINSLMRWNVTSDVASFFLPKDPHLNLGWRIADSAGLDPEGIFLSTESNSSSNETRSPVLLIDTQPRIVTAVAIPAMTGWGMILFILLAGLGAVYYLKRQKRSQD